MPLVRCPHCKSMIPSVAVTCMSCGALPPSCPECSGTGQCATCRLHASMLTSSVPLECLQCGGTKICKACEGRKRRWP